MTEPTTPTGIRFFRGGIMLRTDIVAIEAEARAAAVAREAVWSRLFVDSYCRPEKFETCGDPFCVEARERRDALLSPPSPVREPEAVSLGSILTLTADQNSALAATPERPADEVDG